MTNVSELAHKLGQALLTCPRDELDQGLADDSFFCAFAAQLERKFEQAGLDEWDEGFDCKAERTRLL